MSDVNLQRGPYFTVVNRTSRPLNITVDGINFPMNPGENRDVPAAIAQYAEKQHPRKGTFDATLQFGETLLVVKELCHDPALMSMIPPGKEHLGEETIDRVATPHKTDVSIEQLPRQANREDLNPFGSEAMGAIELIRENPPRG